MERLARKYNIHDTINEGSSCYIYKGRHNKQAIDVAIKFAKTQEYIDQFLIEAKILKCLKGKGAPQLYSFKKRNDPYIVLDLLDTSLIFLVKKNYQISLMLGLLIGHFLLKTLKKLHKLGYTHNDIKPANIMFGEKDGKWQVYLIDFGLATKIGKSQQGFEYFRGNFLYCSRNSLKTYTRDPQDDLESLAFLLVHLITGGLPWMPQNASTTIQQITEQKLQADNQQICREAPQVLLDFLEGIYSQEKFDYDYWIKKFHAVAFSGKRKRKPYYISHLIRTLLLKNERERISNSYFAPKQKKKGRNTSQKASRTPQVKKRNIKLLQSYENQTPTTLEDNMSTPKNLGPTMTSEVRRKISDIKGCMRSSISQNQDILNKFKSYNGNVNCIIQLRVYMTSATI